MNLKVNDLISIKGSEYIILDMVVLYDKNYLLVKLNTAETKIKEEPLIAYQNSDNNNFVLEIDTEIISELKKIFKI